MNALKYVIQSVLVPKTKGIGPKKAEKKAEKITKEAPLKTTLEANYYHNHYYDPASLEKKGYSRYASKKLSDGTILTLALEGEPNFHRYVPTKGPDGRTKLVKASK